MRIATIIGLALAAMLLVSNPSLTVAESAGGVGGEMKGRPLVTLAGTDSGVKAASFRRIGSEAQWKSVWAEHSPRTDGAGQAVPDVDFERCVVVAAFMGQTANCEGLEVDSVIQRPDAVIVRYKFPGYATGLNVKPNAVTPYGFVILPKTDKPIVLEHDVANHKAVTATPPEWKETARLAAEGK